VRFSRQQHWLHLSKYNSIFVLSTTGVHKGGYKHEFFQRDKPELCANIPRCRKKGKMSTIKPSIITRKSFETEGEASSPQYQELLSRSCNENVGSGNNTDCRSSTTLLNDYIGALYGLTRCQQADSRCRLGGDRPDVHRDLQKAEDELHATNSTTLDRISDSSE
jgi:hypothetical protein